MANKQRKEISISISSISILQEQANKLGISFREHASNVISARVNPPQKQVINETEVQSNLVVVRKEVCMHDNIISMLTDQAKKLGISLKKHMSDVIINYVRPKEVEQPKRIKIVARKEIKKAEAKPIRKEVLITITSIELLTAQAEALGVCFRVYCERVLANYVGSSIPVPIDKKAERVAKSRAAATGSNKESPNRRQNDRMQDLAESIARIYDSTNSEMCTRLAELVTLISPKVKYHINKMVENKIDAEDVLSNTVEKIVSKINTYDPFWRFTTWAFKIATNEAKAHKAKKKPVTPNYDIAETITTLDVSAENIEGKENFDILYELAKKCIDVYPDCVDKAVFIDKDINRMPLKELSEKYNLNENTVKTKLKSMRAKIKKSILSLDSEACRKYETFKNISHECV